MTDILRREVADAAIRREIVEGLLRKLVGEGFRCYTRLDDRCIILVFTDTGVEQEIGTYEELCR